MMTSYGTFLLYLIHISPVLNQITLADNHTILLVNERHTRSFWHKKLVGRVGRGEWG